MKNLLKSFTLLFLLAVTLFSCKTNDPTPSAARTASTTSTSSLNIQNVLDTLTSDYVSYQLNGKTYVFNDYINQNLTSQITDTSVVVQGFQGGSGFVGNEVVSMENQTTFNIRFAVPSSISGFRTGNLGTIDTYNSGIQPSINYHVQLEIKNNGVWYQSKSTTDTTNNYNNVISNVISVNKSTQYSEVYYTTGKVNTTLISGTGGTLPVVVYYGFQITYSKP